MICEKVHTPEAQHVAHIAAEQPLNSGEEVDMEVDPVVGFTSAWFEVFEVTEHLLAKSRFEAERAGTAAFADLIVDNTLVPENHAILESGRWRRIATKSTPGCNVKWEPLFADDADDEEMPLISPSANDHEAGGFT
jgi:hypothetical protein